MQPFEFYSERIETLEKHLKKLQIKNAYFGWLRFGLIALIIIVFYFSGTVGMGYAIAIIILMVAVFIRLIYADLDNKASIAHHRYLIKINTDELKFLKGDFYIFPEGNQHIPGDHLYANDLDVFGKASLFQYIDRSTSEMGSRQLADYLKFPATQDLILKRQAAIKELSGKLTWVQDLQATGKEQQISFSTKKRLEKWIAAAPVFSNFSSWKWLRYVLPVIIISFLTLYIVDIISSGIFYSSLLVFMVIAYQVNKKITPVHEQLSKITGELAILSNSIVMIENITFESSLLLEFQSTYIKNVSNDIKSLKKILDRLDLNFNMVLSIPLNVFLLWSLQQVLELEQWKASHKKNINDWFDTLGHIEALNSMAVLHFNEPGWVFPDVSPDHFFIEGNEIGHPLIAKTKRVNNSIEIKNKGELMLVTGSNMAGKSTYLRSIGVNIVLAMAGAPVCAAYLKVSPVQVISSMRIADNLEESTSTFYAELKKLKTIIEKVNKGEKVFILLDEILRGTNSFDRHTGSVALIKQLIKHEAAGIIATHDVELAKMKDELSGKHVKLSF